MKKKIFLTVSAIMYLLGGILTAFYFVAEFSENFLMSPGDRVMILLISCMFMYFGGLLLSKNIDGRHRQKPLKINLAIWMTLYVILLFTLMLFDSSFRRGGLRILNWNSGIFENYIANSFNMIPFAFFLPLLFKKQEKFKIFFLQYCAS